MSEGILGVLVGPVRMLRIRIKDQWRLRMKGESANLFSRKMTVKTMCLSVCVLRELVKTL